MNSAEDIVTATSDICHIFTHDLVKPKPIAFPSVTFGFSFRLTYTVTEATCVENLGLIVWKPLCHNYLVHASAFENETYVPAKVLCTIRC